MAINLTIEFPGEDDIPDELARTYEQDIAQYVAAQIQHICRWRQPAIHIDYFEHPWSN